MIKVEERIVKDDRLNQILFEMVCESENIEAASDAINITVFPELKLEHQMCKDGDNNV